MNFTNEAKVSPHYKQRPRQTDSDAELKDAVQRQMTIRTTFQTARFVKNPVHQNLSCQLKIYFQDPGERVVLLGI